MSAQAEARAAGWTMEWRGIWRHPQYGEVRHQTGAWRRTRRGWYALHVAPPALGPYRTMRAAMRALEESNGTR